MSNVIQPNKNALQMPNTITVTENILQARKNYFI